MSLGPFVVALTMLSSSTLVGAPGDCPAVVTAAAQKTSAEAKITACKPEKEDGKLQYEVKLETKDGRKLELDVSSEGAILLTEEAVAMSSVPKAVMAAFAAKYPNAKATGAERQTAASGKVTYELAFADSKSKRHESTFKEDGAFVEEE